MAERYYGIKTMKQIFYNMKTLFVIVLLLGTAAASDFYYGQTSSGSNNGTSCANAYAYNDATNGMIHKSGAGVTEHICGTWTFGTAATIATFTTGGASGNPFTIKWETGAIVQASYFNASGGFILNGLSNITIDGGTNGLIRNTLNGTGTFALTSLTVAGGTTTAACTANCQPYLNPVNSTDGPTLVNITGTGNASCNVQVSVLTAPTATSFTFATPSGCTSTTGGSFGFQCPAGTCTNKQASVAISATGVTNLEVKNLTCNNIYWHRSIYDSGTTGTYDTNCLVFDGSNNKIHNNTMADGGNVIIYDFGGATNTANWIYNNDFSHGGWVLRCSGGSGSSTDFEFHDNHMHDIGAFDQSNSNVHGNGIHCYDGSGGGFVSMVIYNNLADGDVGTHVTSWYYLEGNSCAAGNDEFGSSGGGSPGTLYFFNNISVENSTTYSHPMNGTVLPSCGSGHLIFNNYIMAFSNLGTGGNADTGYSASPSWTSASLAKFENNIVQEGCFFRIATINAAVVDHNYYAHGTCGNNFWQLPSSNTSSFTTWKTAGWDTNGAYNSAADWPNLNSCATYACGSGVPSSSFAGLGQGANLSSFCTTISTVNSTAGTACLSDTTAGGTRTATARPSSGAWDVGAYQFSSGSLTAPSCTPGTGTYTNNQTITCIGPVGATVCVKFGSAPTTNGAGVCDTGLAYFEPITANKTETLYTISTQSGQTDSSTASFNYTINWGPCGPPKYACTSTSQAAFQLPNPLPLFGPHNTVSAFQYAAGNLAGANTIIQDNITTTISPGLRLLRVTDGSSSTSVPDPTTITNANGTAIPAFNSFSGDYSGNVTDMVWNTDSTKIAVARTSGNSFAVIPFNSTPFQVGGPPLTGSKYYATPANIFSWSQMMPNVFYDMETGTTNCPVSHLCLVQYDATTSYASPAATLLYDFNCAHGGTCTTFNPGVDNCLAQANLITWNGVFSISADDSEFVVALNDGIAAGGQDAGFLYLAFNKALGCRVMNFGWAYQTITSGSTTGSTVTLQLAGSLPCLFYYSGTGVCPASGSPIVGQTYHVSGCTGGTGYNGTGFTLTAINTTSNTVSYSSTSSGTCTGGTIALMDAGHDGGTIWGDYGPTGTMNLYNAQNSNAGNFPTNPPNGVGEGGRAHESFGRNDGVWFEIGMQGQTCQPANPTTGLTCRALDGPFAWNIATTQVVAVHLGGHFALSNTLFGHGTGTPAGQIATIDFATICTGTSCQGNNPTQVNLISSSSPNNLAGFQTGGDVHISWNNAGINDNLFIFPYWDAVNVLVGTPAINGQNGFPAVGTLPAQPLTFGYIGGINGYPTANPGSTNSCNASGGDSCVRQFAHFFTTTFSNLFQAQYAVGAVSQDGRYASITSDCGGGCGSSTGTDASIVGGPDKADATTYPVNFVITPLTGNGSNHTYQSVGSCTTSSGEIATVSTITGTGATATFTASATLSAIFTTGSSVKITNSADYNGTYTITVTSGTTFTFSSTQTATDTAGTATFQYPAGNFTDNTCTWNYAGDQNARNDAFIVELIPQSSAPAPPVLAPATTMFSKNLEDDHRVVFQPIKWSVAGR